MEFGDRSADSDPQRPNVLGQQVGRVHHPGVFFGARARATVLRRQRQLLPDGTTQRPTGFTQRLGEQREVLRVLLSAAEGLQTDRRHGPVAADDVAGVEQRQTVGPPPGILAADRLPGHHSVAPQGPRIEAPADRLDVAFLDRVGRSVVDDDLSELVLAVGHQAVIPAEGPAAHHVVVEHVIERVALPLGTGDVASKAELRPGFGSPQRFSDAFVEGLPEPAKRPVVLEVGRLVQQPRRRSTRPPFVLVRVLVVQVALEDCLVPAVGLEMLGHLAGNFDERFPIPGVERLIGPVAAVVVPFNHAGPVLVERQVEALQRDARTRQIGECGAVEIGPITLVPGGPIELPAVPHGGAALVDLPPLRIREPVQHRAVLVGQPVVVAFVLGQPIAIHLGQETEDIGEREVPDPNGDVELEGLASGPQLQSALVESGGCVVWDVHLAEDTGPGKARHLLLRARHVHRAGKLDHGISERAQLRRYVPVLGEPCPDSLALLVERKRGPYAADRPVQEDLERDELVAGRGQTDLLLLGTP